MTGSKKLTVFYDGACPLCAREIGFYRRRQGADDVAWVDVSGNSDCNVAEGLSKEKALARFHVMQPGGELLSGGRAFAELWAVLPGFRLWGRLFRNRPLSWLLDSSYNVFLRLRPRLQAIMAGQGAKRDDTRPNPAKSSSPDR